MRNFFNTFHTFESDCYVADYTKVTEGKKGVEFSTEPFEDISYFKLQKLRTASNYRGINLEKYPAFIQGISNCECFFIPEVEVEKNWILFLELKYCDKENIENYGLTVVQQMAAVLEKMNDNSLIDITKYTVYFNFSSPDNRPPFTNFMLSCDTALKIKDKYQVKFLGFNHLLIATPQYIQVPKKRI